MNIQFLNTLLDTAGDITLHHFGADNLNVESKADDSPVTIADTLAEKTLRALIKQSYPEHGILGEEFGVESSDADYMWIIDPIDGTRAFMNGIDTFANMVGLLHRGVPIMSAVGFPARGERYIGIDNKAYLNGVEIMASTAPLSECKLSYTGAYMFTPDEFDAVEMVALRSDGVIEGGDAYNYCRMACGDNRVVVESDLKPYDFLPLIPIINGAGGTITDWNGNTLTLNSGTQVVAGGGAYGDALGNLR